MKKRRIVIASLLKPVNDTRMFEKIGNSLAASGNEVFIIGFTLNNAIPPGANVHFLPHGPFARLSFQRLLEPLRIMKKIRKVKPDILIVNTHELLIVATLNRILFGAPIIYDIQENYYRNILFSEAFPAYLRGLLALYVRTKEKLLSPFFNWFLLAEKGYEKEMNFFRDKFTVLENKTRISEDFHRSPDASKTVLLFSGTLAESTGVFQAISLAKKLHSLRDDIELTIIGYCALSAVRDRIKAEIKNHPYIRLLGGDKLVPHSEIIQAIRIAHFGLICYPPSRHTHNSIPTKLYEYLAYQLPIILQNHQPWVDICDPYSAAIPVNFQSIDAPLLLSQLSQTHFYAATPHDVSWSSEEKKLLDLISQF